MPSCPLHLLEVDIAHLGWEQSTAFVNKDSSAGIPQVDGVLICYDATAQSSLKHVEDLLSKLLIPTHKHIFTKFSSLQNACTI